MSEECIYKLIDAFREKKKVEVKRSNHHYIITALKLTDLMDLILQCTIFDSFAAAQWFIDGEELKL